MPANSQFSPNILKFLRITIGMRVGTCEARIALKSGEFGALHGAMAKRGGKLRLVHSQHLLGGEHNHGGARLKFRMSAGSGTLVVGTTALTFVAAKEPIAYALRHPLRQLSIAILNGLARKAFFGIEHSALQGATGAMALARATIAAGEGAWRIGWQSEGGDQFAKKEKRALAGDDEQRVSPAKSQACLLRPVALENGRAIHAHAR